MTIKVEGLHKEFLHEGNILRVLNGIDLELKQGEMVSIRGRSGAGKSTFMHLLGALDSPTSGRILFGDKDIFTYTPSQLAKFRNEHIGLMFQFHHLLNEFTALENVMMPLLIHRETRNAAKKKALGLLERVGLQDRSTHKPGELSGGEQQRVALARALVMEPSLLLADEPTGNLDKVTGEGIHKIFAEINQSLNLTIVVVTHDDTLARRMKRRLMMQDGLLEEAQDEPIEQEPTTVAEESDASADSEVATV